MTDSPDAERDWIQTAVETYERPLLRYAFRLLGDEPRARDVVQDTFLKLWQADRNAIEGHLAQWLYRVCRNRALDVLRKDGRMTTLDSETVDLARSTEAPAETPTASQGDVLSLMADLPERQQEALRLKFQAGLSYREIGTVMDMTVSHVGVVIHNGIKSLREKLNAAPTIQTNPTLSR